MSKRPTATALIAANLVPVGGVLFWGWSVFDIVFLFWIENIIIGVVNVLRMAFNNPPNGLASMVPGKVSEARKANMPGAASRALPFQAFKLFLIPFFMFHYGMFCAGHGVFIFAFFTGNGPLSSGEGATPAFTWPLALAVGSLAASHLYSFVTNYLRGGEYRRTDLRALMARPYGRVVVLHITIIAGGFLSMFFGNAIGLLVVMLGLKIAVDLKLHFVERRKFADMPIRPVSSGRRSSVAKAASGPHAPSEHTRTTARSTETV